MFRLFLIILGIIAALLVGIFGFMVIVGSPFQTMEWNSFSVEEITPSPSEESASDTEVINSGLPVVDDKKEISEKILHEVPFSAQAPYGEWQDARYQDGCEEASVLMAVRGARHKDLTREEARDEIALISQYELDNYGYYVDTSASATLERLVVGYFHYTGQVQYGIDQEDILEALYDNNLVLVPTNGQLLKNPNYSPPGPERHMLVIRGYDPESGRFITNDPGTRRGTEYEYDSEVLFNAIGDYPSGEHIPSNNPLVKAMLVIPIEPK